MKKKCLFYHLVSSLLILTLIVLPVGQLSAAFAEAPSESKFYLPGPSQRLSLTREFQPTLVKGITIYPRNPLLFDFIIDPLQTRGSDAFDKEIKKTINYFFASLTIPKNDLWVNLSPYEKNRIVPESLGATEMGRDLLAQDYLLKQLTASLMDPDTALGKEFWNKVYQKTNARFKTTNIAMNTFNKVWIVPSRAVVYQQWPSAFVVDSYLKVMLEEDYTALTHHISGTQQRAGASRLASDIIKELIIPKIEKEVNEGRHFAPLRQIYHAMILAEWYKRTLKQSLLAKVYVNQNKIKGIDLKDKNIKNKIFQRYLSAYRKGLYNFVKEDYDALTGEIVPRKYFAGGINLYAAPVDIETDRSMLTAFELGNLPAADNAQITVIAVPETDEEQLAWIKKRLYPHGDHTPVELIMDQGTDQNRLSLGGGIFAHALSFPAQKSRVFYLSIPDGDKVVEMMLSGDTTTSSLAGIHPAQPLPVAVLNEPGLIRHPDNPRLPGGSFSIQINPTPSNSTVTLKLSRILFGSGKSIRDYDRTGPGDPAAKRDTEAFVGNDLLVKEWKKIDGPEHSGIVMQAVNQPGAMSRDVHNYVLRLKFPEGVRVDADDSNNLIITLPNQQASAIQVELYSDHTPIQHLALEDLYNLDTLERWISLQDDDQKWHLQGTPENYVNFKSNVAKLRELEFNLEPGPNNQLSSIEIAQLKDHIRGLGEALGLTESQMRMALDPVSSYAQIPFFKLDHLTRMLYTGLYLFSNNLPMLAGSPYYTNVFPPDNFIVQTELLGFLKPEIVRNQFYQLLKLERNGQFPHEVDIRHSSHVPGFLDDRYRLIRADTELLAVLYTSMVMDHEKEYGIEWSKQIRGTETVGDIVAKVARYVLGKAQALKNADDFHDLLTPKIEGDPRGSWRDSAPSTFYGKYIYTLQYLMVPALKAIEKINAQKNIVREDVDFKSLIQTWLSAREQFKFTQTREERIQALMNWFRWKISREKNKNDGLNYVLALFEDAKKYYGISNYDFDDSSEDELLSSIEGFLEKYMPQEEFPMQAIALDGNGKPIKINDTDPFMFSSSMENLSMEEIKNGLKSEFLHVVFGGTSTTSGELLTGIPTVLGTDRFVETPVGVEGPVDIYEKHRGNYHTIKWISMEYKKLNGLIRQINHLLDNGKDISLDVNNLILAVMLRFDELARLSDQETQETLEPFASSSIRGIRLGWRPFGSAEALAKDKDDEEAQGIRSGAVQGFNLMVMAANNSFEELLELLAARSKEGNSFVVSLRNRISQNPAEARQVVTQWLKESPSGAAVDAAMQTQHSNLGGIDLNADLLNLTIINNEKNDLPSSFYDTNFSPTNIEGITPKIIHDAPLHLTTDDSLRGVAAANSN